MRKFLVTGGAGFIGSNLCEYLLKAGEEVTCLDNFATGKFENIEALLREYPERFKLQVGDIRKPEDCRKAVAEAEYVFHEAALGSVPRSINDPQTTNEVNISGFLNMLVAARDAGVRRFVYAASSSTYGDSQNLPKVEEVIGRPLSPYAHHQICERALCRCVRTGIWDGMYRFTLLQRIRTPAIAGRCLCCRYPEIRGTTDAV